ncbi:MAG: hypothetical protein K2G09_10155 [Paramuribaculum sp.]|nr:hypothetical protein [Paramuribaculum sp.]
MDTKDENRDISGKRKKSGVRKILKWVFVPIAILLLLVAAVISIGVWMLSPDELTPMVSKYSSRYLDADVTAGKVELSFWSTFPKVSLEVDDLTVVSHTLKNVPDSIRRQLPANADTLINLKHFDGGVNIWALMGGTVMLYDVTFREPDVNIVQVNDSVANYLIVPPTADTTATDLPYISIDRFAIEGGAPVRVFSLADSIDLSVKITEATLAGSSAPVYAIDIDGIGGGEIMPGLRLSDMTFGVDGRVDWNQRKPNHIELKDFTVSANNVGVKMNTKVNFEKSPVIESLTLGGEKIKIADLIAMVPEQYLESLKQIDTDVQLDFNAELLKPYQIDSKSLPALKASVRIPGGYLNYDRMALNSLRADINALLPDGNPELAQININELAVQGRSLKFTLEGLIRNLTADAEVDGRFRGQLNTSMLPGALWRKLKWHASGIIDGDTRLRFRLSEFNPKQFHRVKADGNVALRNFALTSAENDIALTAGNMKMSFGTSAKITIADSLRADSLLKVSLKADTLIFRGEGINLSAANADFVVAARNVAGSMDTSKINPIGIALRAARMKLTVDSDSVNLLLRDAAVKATLKRYGNSAKAPLLNLDLSAERMRYRDEINSMSLSGASANLTLHPIARNRTVRDSVSRARLRDRVRKSDSISRSSGKENMDFGVDRTLSSLLRKWKAEGSVKARRGRLVTPYFPVKNTLRNLDMSFSTDSVVIRNTGYSLGKSDFVINGSITNIARALTSRRGSPLKIKFDIQSDTININEIYEAVSAGSTFAERLAKGQVTLVQTDDDDARQAAIKKETDTYDTPAFIVPSNIDASLNIKAKEVLYADIWFQKLDGKIGIKNGAVHLDRLAGYTPIGSMDLTALYSAPTKKDIHFAAGVVVRSLRLKEFLNLLPQIDTVLPLLREVNGIITADVAMNTEIDSMMNLKFNTFKLVMKLTGDSLVLVDNKTFEKMAKWLMFKKKDRNLINSMKVELMIKDTKLDVFPFVFDLDRYKIGVSGHNTLDMDLDYHIAVLKSPIPFKFGVNIKGKPGHLKIRLGRANFDENKIAFSHQLTDTLRMNLVNEIREVFEFGARTGRHTNLILRNPKEYAGEFMVADTLTHEDSLIFIQGGAIDGPAVPPFPMDDNPVKHKKKDKKKHH